MSASIARHCAGYQGEDIQPNSQNSGLQKVYTLQGGGQHIQANTQMTLYVGSGMDVLTGGDRTSWKVKQGQGDI